MMRSTQQKKRYAGIQRLRGMTLVELLVAMIVLAALMAGISELVVTNTLNASATSNLARLQETGRTAMKVITDDIRRAGYFGGHFDPGNFLTASSVLGSAGISSNAATCPTVGSNWARMLGQPVFGLNDTRAGYDCVTSGDYSQGDIITLRYAPAPPITGGWVANRPYIRTTVVDGKVFLGKDEASAANEVDDTSARAFELAAHTYFIGDTTRTCGSDDGEDIAIPALFRKAVDKKTGLPVTQELLAGVEHLQIRYKVGNSYLEANDVTSWEAGNIEAVETTLLVRSECPETGFVNPRKFDMGDIAAYPAQADGFRRQIFTSITSLRN